MLSEENEPLTISEKREGVLMKLNWKIFWAQVKAKLDPTANILELLATDTDVLKKDLNLDKNPNVRVMKKDSS